MIKNVNINLKRALVFSLILNSTLAFSGFYTRTYDSYPHMFFADHYRRAWFDTWEPKWYTGFNVASYPPLAHQTLALLSLATGLEAAYIIITLLLMVLMPLALFKLAKLFVSEEAAAYSALLSVFFPGILICVYAWGQYTTLFGLFLTILTGPAFDRYLKEGGALNFAALFFLFEATIAAHHFSGVFFTPLLLLSILLTAIIKEKTALKLLLKRFFVFLASGLLFSWLVLYPVLFGAVGQNVHVPHPSTLNYCLNLDVFGPFFLAMHGFFLILISLSTAIIRRRKDLQPLFAVALFFIILGLGGTTPLPKIVFGSSWLGLTYDRFNLFAFVCFAPLLGETCVFMQRKKGGKAFIAVFMLLSILFAGFAGNLASFNPRPTDAPVERLANFLNHDEHWRWRYLTLGFGAYDFGKLSILSNATTLDGWYYRGRNISTLANSGVGYLSDAKFYENGISVLKAILENASQYNLKFVFCNDKFYESLLNETGFVLVNEYYEQVTVWEKPGVPTLDMAEIVRFNHAPTLLDIVWGIVPMLWLTGYVAVSIFKAYKKRFLKVSFANNYLTTAGNV